MKKKTSNTHPVLPANFGNNIFDAVEVRKVSWRVPPFQLVTLYDLMKFYAQNFLHIVSILGHLRNSLYTLEALMETLSNTEAIADWERKYKVTENLQDMKVECEEAKLCDAARQIGIILKRLENPDLRFEYLRVALESVQEAIIGGFQDSTFIRIPEDKIQYYEATHPFGSDVSDRFPKAMSDIQEAAKCLALGRYTACVFHLGRVMEHVTKQLGKKFSVPNVERENWGAILKKVEKDLDNRKNPQTHKLTNAERDRNQKYSKAVALLMAVKDAWRNEVAHPKASYTEEEAKDVYQHVSAFMRQITKDRLTSGKPIK